jgi:hypothetical protein
MNGLPVKEERVEDDDVCSMVATPRLLEGFRRSG